MNVPAKMYPRVGDPPLPNNEKLFNGQLSDDQLMFITKREKLYIPAAESFLKMMEEAKKVGISYRIADTYRLCGEPGDGEKYLRGEVEFNQWAAWELYQAKLANKGNEKYKNFNLSADPTNGCKSKHGFGLAIDIYNPKYYPRSWFFLDKDGKLPVRQDPTQQWITDNGLKYGWKWTGKDFPYVEPWHFDYFIQYDTTRPDEAPIARKTPTQINNQTYQDQKLQAINKTISRNIQGFFS